MSKLKLNLRNLEGAEVLTREQLKMVMGGDSGSGQCGSSCDGGCKRGDGTSGKCYVAQSGPNQGKCYCV